MPPDDDAKKAGVATSLFVWQCNQILDFWGTNSNCNDDTFFGH